MRNGEGGRQKAERLNRGRRKAEGGSPGLARRNAFRYNGNMKTVTVTLREEDRQFIDAAMKTGRYVSESEAVSDAIGELRAREELRQARLGELRAKVAIGIEQLERGEASEWKVEEIKAKGRASRGSRATGL